MDRLLRTCALLILAAVPLQAQQLERSIPNGLGETWPLENVYFEFQPTDVKGPLTCTIQGITRPTQPERVKEGNRESVRLWTVATLGAKDDAGNPLPNRADPRLKNVRAVFKPGTAASPLSIQDEGEYYLIKNGTYAVRVRHYRGDFAAPTPLEKIPHWLGGIRVRETDPWDARAVFQGPALMKGAHTEILAQGPVFIDLKITVYSEQPAAPGTVNAVPLRPGKQSFHFPPNEVPTESVPKLTNHYEAVVRFVMDDPWIDVSERYHFPRDAAIKPWGFNLEFIEFGGKSGMPVDTAMWVRWFEWDQFGGNTDLQFAPALPRAAQKGRPFTMLRPLWNQGPGGSQDFFLTSGGPSPRFDEKTKTYTDTSGRYNPDAPAIGIYAAFPSKWVGPFSQTIVCQAEGGNAGSWRLPLVPAEDVRNGIVPGMHYGQRAFGICAGPRRLFDNTGLANGIVRRHTDWTLVALINKYVLDWPRDPSKAGPHLIVGKARIEQLRNDLKSGRNTAETALLRESLAALPGMQEKEKALQAQLKALDDTPKAGRPADFDDKKKALQAELKPLSAALSGEDNSILRLLTDGSGKASFLPSSGLWRERRYQDDFLNPTSPSVRSIQRIKMADLFANGNPVGGADQAALAYIVCDPDAWMGYKNGWLPGNPNFHTDKYLSALYLGGSMLDHPHAKEWMEFARLNFLADASGVLLPPDGVGVECPGYSGYAMDLILPMAAAFQNLGYGNIPAENPLFKGTGIWHRKLLTPVDPRLGRRHEAPIGDTHRWDSGMAEYFGDLARFYREKDPVFASEMMSTWRSLERSGVNSRRSPAQRLLAMDYTLPDRKLEAMDWSSQAFYGFGAVLRANFGTARETFVSYKAGEVRGHYHNDENSFHYYALGMPVSLDYNCSYHPRGDHAALHNSLTFGRLGTITNNQRNTPVEAQEQLTSSAAVGAFVSKPNGDLIVSERKGKSLSMDPVRPEDSEFQRAYPTRDVGELVHRRLLLLVKHPAASAMTDYLVVRDETKGSVEQQVNVHLLARDIQTDGRHVEAVGQQGVDMSLFIAAGAGPDGGEPRIGLREWHYSDEYLGGPEAYAIHEGESVGDWDRRMDALMKQNNVTELPLPGYKPMTGVESAKPWQQLIGKTGGQALIPPKNWHAPWLYGEYQKWLRIETKPGSPVLWVLYPYRKGDTRPELVRIDDQTVKITHLGETEEVFMDSAGGVKVKTAAGSQVILEAGKLPALGDIKANPAAPGGVEIDR